jgi:hypothetical protein
LAIVACQPGFACRALVGPDLKRFDLYCGKFYE